MHPILIRIKRAVIAGDFILTHKARIEMAADGLVDSDVVESILNAEDIYKIIRSTSSLREHSREYLYIIQSEDYSGDFLYTKGKLKKLNGVDFFYILISAKRAI